MKKTKIVIFGITGDLSRRKLLPSLDNALRTNKIDNIEIIGVSRREINVADLLTKTHSIDIEHTPLRYIIKGFSMDLDNPNDYANLKNFINLENDEQLLLYLSVPAASAMNIAKNCGDVGINSNNVKILLEKPFGYDLESAEEFINCINKYYSEEQTYRIDHYLAKTAALNVVKYRLQNPQINTK
jgi:glucose-6-phosphate 1-dehydrogenase